MKTQNYQQTLYETDFLTWIETTANLLKKRQLEQIDYEHLIEELETMGKCEKNSLESNLRVLLMHLLKWQYEPERRSNSWQYTITEHRLRIKKAFKVSPSLKRYFDEVFDECYQDARLLAAKETGLSLDTFPNDFPFTVENVLDFDELSK